MSIHDQLYNKLSVEFDRYTSGLVNLPPNKILDEAYKKTFMEDILVFFESDDFVDEVDATVLLSLKNPMQALYKGWEDTDPTYLDHLRDSITNTIREIQTEPQYYEFECDCHKSGESSFNIPTTAVINGEIKHLDMVIATSDSDYPYLVGMVKSVDKLGSPEHESGNLTDDVVVDFASAECSDGRKQEIEEHFHKLTGEYKRYDDLPLDNVIMSPDHLIRITNLRINDIELLSDRFSDAQSFCTNYENGIVPYMAKHAELIERVNRNYEDYNKSLLSFGIRELIDMAGKINAVSDAHSYLTMYHLFDHAELDFYLKFENPLDLVSDVWYDQRSDLDEMSYTMDNITDSRDEMFTVYPLMSDAAVPDDTTKPCRFMGVDLIDFLGKIAEKVIVNAPNDWHIDIEVLNHIASSQNFNDKRIWQIHSNGSQIQPENEVFIKGSNAYNIITDCHNNAAEMIGYVVEITGVDGQTVIGNVYEVGDYAEYAKHIHDTAEPFESLTVIYSSEYGENAGKTINIKRDVCDADRIRSLDEEAHIDKIVYHPEDKSRLAGLIVSEQLKRKAYPIGCMETHLQAVMDRLSEIQKPSVTVKKNPEKQQNAENKNKLKNKMDAANIKVKAQESQNKNKQTRKREERS